MHFNPDATRAPVAFKYSLLVTISLVVKHKCYFKQLNVKTAFLNSPFERDVWVRFPAGYVHHRYHSFVKVRISLCCLRQAAADWYELERHRLTALDSTLARSTADPYFDYMIQDGHMFIVLVHADDYTVAYSEQLYFDACHAHF